MVEIDNIINKIKKRNNNYIKVKTINLNYENIALYFAIYSEFIFKLLYEEIN